LDLPKKKSYKGKVVVITGASSGIGEELAIQFAKLGSKLVLAARRIENLESLVSKCKKLGTDAIAVRTDVSKESDCKELVDATIKKYGTLDVLVLNAGVGCIMKLSEAEDMKAFRDTMEINFWGYVYPTYHALSSLRKSKGTIIAISSLAAILPTPRRNVYGASKAAVITFLNCLRQEESAIQITIVCPGFVKTEIHDHAHTPGNEKLHRELGNFMSATECANITIDCAANGVQLHVMTLKARIAYYFRPFITKFVDKLAKNHAEASFIRSQ